MNQMLDSIKMTRDALNIVNISEDLAYMVMRDLEEAGFMTELKKEKIKKPKTWRIIPLEELSPTDMIRFNELKEERTNYWRNETTKNLKKNFLRK